MTDLEGRYTYISPADERNTGVKAEDGLGKCIRDFLSESTIPETLELFARVIKGESFEGLELQVQTKDGTPFFIECNINSKNFHPLRRVRYTATLAHTSAAECTDSAHVQTVFHGTCATI